MDGTTVRRLRRRLGLTQSQFAERLGVHLVTVKKWETGAQRIGPLAARLLQLFAQQAGAVTSRHRTAPARRRAPRRKER